MNDSSSILLLDIGNTHTHAALARRGRVGRQIEVPTAAWMRREVPELLAAWARHRRPSSAALCSVVPQATRYVREWICGWMGAEPFELNHRRVWGIGIRYPQPRQIGADRLANAMAAWNRWRQAVVVVDFGTAVTFDVIDRRGDYIGGIIAPGLAAMTDYLHEKTALLPRIRIREPQSVVGKNTQQAMLSGAVHGYRGLIRGLLQELRKELGTSRIPVIATGGYAALIAARMPEIASVVPTLTLEGLLLAHRHAHAS